MNETESLKNEIEVLLYCRNEAVSLKEIGELLDIKRSQIEPALGELLREYDLRETGLCILCHEGKYALAARPEYESLVRRLIKPELRDALLKTLAIIALKQPVRQSDIVRRRGSIAYEHIHDLEERKLIVREKSGSSYLLKTSPKFNRDYDLSEEKLLALSERAEADQ